MINATMKKAHNLVRMNYSAFSLLSESTSLYVGHFVWDKLKKRRAETMMSMHAAEFIIAGYYLQVSMIYYDSLP